MRSYAASELEIFRRVRVPTALPYLFTALKVASVLAMIGAIVGEYFGGAINALGVLIRNSARDLPVRRRRGRRSSSRRCSGSRSTARSSPRERLVARAGDPSTRSEDRAESTPERQQIGPKEE